MSIYCGTNSKRQSVGLPGHCDRCAEVGHEVAHPNFGCSDVGCSSAHPEPATDTTPVRAIATVALLWNATHPHARPTVLDGGDHPDGLNYLPTHLFHSIREYRDYDRPPLGCLYTATGAHRLDDLLATMWTCPEAEALRTLPSGGGRYSEPNLVIQERADFTFKTMWARFLDSVAR